MKKTKFITLIFTALIMFYGFSTVKAQDDNAFDEMPNQDVRQKRRPNLLAELDLSPQQIQQIRRINREIQPQKRQARQRMLEANQALDQAIYDDKADEVLIEARLKDFQIAQGELAKINAMTEFAVRRILLPEQLTKFREIRRSFRERNPNRRNLKQRRSLDEPKQKLQNRQQQLRQ